MFEVRQLPEFTKWLAQLRDKDASLRIGRRLERLEEGQFGDAKFFDGIGELRVDSGPGYRIYLVVRRRTFIVLLCGGDKSSQARDIRKAKELAKEA